MIDGEFVSRTFLQLFLTNDAGIPTHLIRNRLPCLSYHPRCWVTMVVEQVLQHKIIFRTYNA